MILGIVQGLTEFLPISSSGHLVLVGKYLPLNQPGILFEVILHIGTTLAVLWYFRARLMQITKREIVLLGVGTVPAAIVGILFSDQLENLFASIKLVGVGFLVSALLNYLTDKADGTREKLDSLDAFVIGVFQAFAIIPSISRSGATIFAGTKMQLSRHAAAEYSFLLSIPAILGANVVEFLKYKGDVSFSLPLSVIGFLFSFVVGLASIGFLMRMLTERRLKYFSAYLIVLGVITILFL